MEVRKFRAPTIQEATSMVRQDLGGDALILSTRKLEQVKSGMGRLFEIWAVAGGERREDSTKDVQKDSAALDTVMSDLASIKEMLFMLSRPSVSIKGLAENPDALELYVKMIRGGISESNAHIFLRKGGVLENQAKTDFERLSKRVLKKIMEVVDVADPFGPSDEQVVAALVGPTGVGKTTTIAKLVADLVLKQKRTVGLISIDNYRIGAVDQLKTYAAILGVPCFSAFSSVDLESAMKRLKEKDLILIDTAGQSHYDMARMDELAGLIDSAPAIKCHLLLSAATHETEMVEAAKNFEKLNYSSYIFTKTDETKTRGVIINQILKSRMPISYVTTGQRVPEDILKATKMGILGLVFK
jgi:flagellar biosynthesis protein FlhF